MAKEIEGKWLQNSPEVVFKYGKILDIDDIEQGYVAVDPNGTSVRVRKSTSVRWPRKRPDFTETVKGKRNDDGEADEVNIILNEGNFAGLWSLTVGRRLIKRRYVIDLGSTSLPSIVEVDVFGGVHEGLVVVEAEMDTAEELRVLRANPPAWFGPDVSDDVSYKNVWLSQHGLPEGWWELANS